MRTPRCCSKPSCSKPIIEVEFTRESHVMRDSGFSVNLQTICLYVMPVPQKRKHLRTTDFRQGLKPHVDTNGTHLPKKLRYVDLSDDEKPPQNGTAPYHRMLNGYSLKNERLKYERALLSTSAGEGSTSRLGSAANSQLQEQRKQLPIAKGRCLNIELQSIPPLLRARPWCSRRGN